jgi:hypothetical protein
MRKQTLDRDKEEKHYRHQHLGYIPTGTHLGTAHVYRRADDQVSIGNSLYRYFMEFNGQVRELSLARDDEEAIPNAVFELRDRMKRELHDLQSEIKDKRKLIRALREAMPSEGHDYDGRRAYARKMQQRETSRLRKRFRFDER